jgi:hypothetical protein
MTSFLFGFASGAGVTFLMLVVFGLCTAAKRADEAADRVLADKRSEPSEPPDERGKVVYIVPGDGSLN